MRSSAVIRAFASGLRDAARHCKISELIARFQSRSRSRVKWSFIAVTRFSVRRVNHVPVGMIMLQVGNSSHDIDLLPQQ